MHTTPDLTKFQLAKDEINDIPTVQLRANVTDQIWCILYDGKVYPIGDESIANYFADGFNPSGWMSTDAYYLIAN